MSPKRFLLLPALLLLLYLGVYSWNQRTHVLDDFTAFIGLEATGAVFKSVLAVRDAAHDAWSRYLDIVGVREENEELKKQLSEARFRLILAAEERAELLRLRDLLALSPPEGWTSVAARVLAGRLGPNAALVSVTIGRGYLNGAVPGTPVMTPEGIAGRVLRAGPTTATVLLLADPGSRVAVISQDNRVQGILTGAGPFRPLELEFVSHNTAVEPGEILVTSGLDGAFPKGVPVARVVSATPSDVSPFQSVQAELLADLSHLEELLLIERKAGVLPGEVSPVRSPVEDLVLLPRRSAVTPAPATPGAR